MYICAEGEWQMWGHVQGIAKGSLYVDCFVLPNARIKFRNRRQDHRKFRDFSLCTISLFVV